MEDVELEQLELQIRKSAAGHAPAAPDALLKFIDTVPAIEPAGRRFGFGFGLSAGSGAAARPAIRRAFFALAAAAVLVVGLAGGAALVKIRADQTAGAPGASSGWTWQKADGTAVGFVSRVSGGFVGICTQAAGTDLACSSRDGATWAAPADPAVFSVTGTASFLPRQVVRSGTVYVASGEQGPCLPSGVCRTPAPIPSASDVSRSLWRSTDGIHWSRVVSPAFSGLNSLAVGIIPSGFVAVGLAADTSPAGVDWALTSTDGLTWSRASQLPVKPGSELGQAAGFASQMEVLPSDPMEGTALWAAGSMGVYVANGSSSAPVEWRSLDGKTWEQVHLPSGFTFVFGGRTSDGSYLGGGFMTPSAAPSGVQVVRSSDGLTWYVDQGNLEGSMTDLAYVGGRLVTSVYGSPAGAGSGASGSAAGTESIWESSDLGHIWRPLLDPAGRPMLGAVGQIGDRLAIYPSSATPAGSSRGLMLLGSLGDSAPRPTATPMPT